MAELTAALVTHRRAPLDVLGRLPRGAALAPALTDLVDGLVLDGAVGLATCNRFELYLEAPAPVTAAALVGRLGALSGLSAGSLHGCVEVVHGEAAVRHLFTVAAGLDSRLVGEEEVLGQVRAAARAAQEGGTATPTLCALFEWAVRSGRRARRAAGLSQQRVSLADQAVELLARRLDPLRGRTVLLLGSGHMARRVMAALQDAGARAVLLVRRPESVTAPGVPVLGLDELPRAVERADAVLCATSAPRPLLTADLLARAAQHRAGRRPLLVVDLAVPRNVEAPAGRLDGAEVVDLDSLVDGAPDPAFEASTREAAAVVGEEARAFCRRQDRSGVGPLIEQVLRHGESVRRAELARAVRLSPATDPQLLDELTARLVSKVLHGPVSAIRRHAGAGDGDLAELIAATMAGSTG